MNKKYDAKADTFMGGVLLNLGYITQEQRDKIDALDGMAKRLQSNNPAFKKPFYGQIATGEGAEKITKELTQQVASGKIKPDDPLKKSLDKLDSVSLAIKGEKKGSDVERKGGPIDSCLKVQKELRELERMGMLPDSADKMRETTKDIADRLGVAYPDKPAQPQPDRAEAGIDVDAILRKSVEVLNSPDPEPVEKNSR